MIDTANKRAGSLIDACGIDYPPDGAIDALDRPILVGQYPAGVGVVTGGADLPRRRRKNLWRKLKELSPWRKPGQEYDEHPGHEPERKRFKYAEPRHFACRGIAATSGFEASASASLFRTAVHHEYRGIAEVERYEASAIVTRKKHRGRSSPAQLSESVVDFDSYLTWTKMAHAEDAILLLGRGD